MTNYFKLPLTNGSMRATVCLIATLTGISIQAVSALPTPPDQTPPFYKLQVVKSFPHDRSAFTQGLVVHDGGFLESTGLNGHSTLRKVDIATGKVKRQIEVPARYFAEGMTLLNGKIYQLTWQAQVGFIYDPATFKKLGEFKYDGEGWGLTHNGTDLILSDGTNIIRFLDPKTFAVKRSIQVKSEGLPVDKLNELEFIHGEIYANVWQTDYIVRINPVNGQVVGWIDCTGLLPTAEHKPDTDVLNGIAYDAAADRLFVTGKLWPKVYEVKVKKK